ncbi:uncharacterized protein LOC116296526 [Actinia tenebrosa]|uniref:Uncharacterized protein LOC116296526 n=1 Tax=Actinia tenebrosa TaxID=6105 RepID=A0A6P8I5Z4_ACTTE|nr:uncharacterized protein LOC116296526 [Actinia tenebrosa]
MIILRLFYSFILLIIFLDPIEAISFTDPSFKDVKIQTFEEDGDFVFVFDNLFSPQTMQSYLGLVSYGNIQGMVSSWQYAYKDYYFNIQIANSTINAPWLSPIDPNFFVKTSLWGKIQKVSEKISGGKVYFPREVSVSMVRRLDFTTTDPAKSSDKDELVARILLAPSVKKNDYGESIFYNQKGESMAAVFPKFGRLLMWNASIPYLYKPPAMSYLQGLYSITIKLTTDKDKMDVGAKETKDQIFKTDQYSEMDFPLTDEKTLPEINFEDHLTKKIYDSKNHVVAYFDDLMPKGDLDALRLFLLHYNSAYAYQGYDESADTEHDNVSWIAPIKVSKFIKSRLWKTVNRTVEYLSGKSGWFPYDVSMNIIRNSHYTRIHEDCEPHEDEYTVLMYLTPDWKAEYYGETAYFEEVMQPNGNPYPKGHQKYEWLTSVRPRYGRMVIFRGIIPHSARPPSPGFTGARYTFACKVSKTRQVAMAKMLRETIEDVEPGEPDYDLLQDLGEGLYDTPSPGKTVEFLEAEVEMRRQKKRERINDMKEELIQAVYS